jgi:DNA gyrase inhibitor GyrI
MLLDTLRRFLDLARTHGRYDEYRLGTASPAWGWTGGGSNRRELRCVLVTDVEAVPEPPLEPWEMGAHRYARFDFAGETTRLGDVYMWLFREWMRTSVYQYAFAPVVTLYDDAVWYESGFQRSRARIYVPIERFG